MPQVDVKVPDIGDFRDVPVIDVLVKPGDTVSPEDPLVTVESDKATMDIPSPAQGVVKAIAVKVGDKVSEGTMLLTVESEVPSPRPSPASGRGGSGSRVTRRCSTARTKAATSCGRARSLGRWSGPVRCRCCGSTRPAR
jgi:pyruvate/2-oxoglutarate dehydrogenase complex dihydrolipoamide acyltransferase (E2) component